jgi:hypothetical protein
MEFSVMSASAHQLSVALLLFTAIGSADEISHTDPRLPAPLTVPQWTPPPPPESLPPAQVLRETEYVLPSEGRSVIVQEVNPPPAPEVMLPPPVPTLSEAERAARFERMKAAAASRPKYKAHWFSCTVYDGKYTHVRWSHKGQSYTAWSGLDWNDFAGVTSFLSGAEPATRHSLIFGLGNVSTTNPRRPGTIPALVPQDLPAFTDDGPDFVITKGDAANAEATEGFRLLHELHVREKTALQAARANREELQRQSRAWHQANPPLPRDTIIRFGRRESRP